MNRYKTRMRFTKTGSVRFVGHLDLMRSFQKTIRRAGLDVAYSQGFSPHQLMSFASPLGLGATTDGDHIDVEFLPDSPPPKQLMEQLNRQMNDEFFITDIERMPDGFKNSMSLLTHSSYMITAKTADAFPDDYRERFVEFCSRDSIWITKKTKKSEKQIDLKPAISVYAFEQNEYEKLSGETLPTLHPVYTGDSIYMKLPSESSDTVKPEQVMEAFFAHLEWESEPWSYHVHRLMQYFREP